MMQKALLFILLFINPSTCLPQKDSFSKFITSPGMKQASAGLSIIDSQDGSVIYDYASNRRLTPASVIKLATTAAAMELLGPDYTFKTSFGYSGNLDHTTGVLKGDIIIKGGGDPALGSSNFAGHYGDFTGRWIQVLKKAGIKHVEGRIIVDDSRYDYLPVPATWPWEDIGNYYGAGVYGLSVFDNTYEIHFRTSSDSTIPVITGIYPYECTMELENRLIASGNSDKGYVFAVPYSREGWISGSIPVNRNDFVLKASIPDPPMILARILQEKLADDGIRVTGTPVTSRILKKSLPADITILLDITSPPLKEIISFLNHKSINLYAEHLTKELGRVYRNSPTTSSGISVIIEFLERSGIEPPALEDGSGLSPADEISPHAMTSLLYYMKNKGKHFPEYFDSLAEGGKEGTLRAYFRDTAFNSSIRAKSGSMPGVRAFAGYLTARSGRKLAFCIIVNHFSGSGQDVVKGIEEILKETIQEN
jgi:D-alanyl-D-alanine carboxypeptidase/D-alanyl-D-alanine-endopeptidase (penicillin-binding protein 4)